MVEHLDNGGAQRLGAVEDEQRRAGDIHTAVAQIDQQRTDQGGVLGRVLDQGQRMLHPEDVDPQGDDAQMASEVDPVDHHRDEIEPGQVGS